MASSLIEPVARVGFAARGAVYMTMGVLAARSALGTRGGRTTNAQGAVREIGRESAILLLALGAGLVAYAVWRFAQALHDLDGKGTDAKGLATRAGFIGSGLVHLGLAATAAGIGFGGGSSGIRTWVGRALAEPWGVWAVGLAGAIVVGAGLYQFYKGWAASFEKRFRTAEMGAGMRRWARRIGRLGLAARGVTFLIIGWCLVRAAFYVNAREAKDVGGALRTLQAQEYGAWLLGIVACGLVAYGLLSLLNARYRRIVA
jgi:hypothetical protein